MNIEILNIPDSNNPFLVIYKPSGLPSAPLSENDENNALWQALIKYPQIKQVTGRKKIEFGLLHRLDTVTEGLLLIALNQDFYDSMLLQQEDGNFIKTYSAICENRVCAKEGFPPYENHLFLEPGTKIIVSSYFRGFGKGQKEVRPVIDSNNKYITKKTNLNTLYQTEIIIFTNQNNRIKVECKIKKGYRHQVRCHLAWIGLPIINDSLYNILSSEQILFKAVGLDFSYKGKNYSFRKD